MAIQDIILGFIYTFVGWYVYAASVRGAARRSSPNASDVVSHLTDVQSTNLEDNEPSLTIVKR